jgi:outer membrane receptor for ferrienterochelin and colicins
MGDYSGLFGRSPHSSTLRATYSHKPHGLSVSIRGRWRSRYGFRDLDGNGLANRDDEFVPAYAIFDATITKSITLPRSFHAEIQGGLDNAFDIMRSAFVPSLPGRRIYAALRLSF